MSSNNISISLKNFKSLQNIINLEIKPLTFLFGKNGSGKSSFIQSLLFLSHNIQNPIEILDYKRSERINTSFFKSKDFDLISFKDIVQSISDQKCITYNLYFPTSFYTYGRWLRDISVDISILENGDVVSIKKLAEHLEKYFIDSTSFLEAELMGTKPDVCEKREKFIVEFRFGNQKEAFTSPLEKITIKNSNEKILFQFCPNKHSKTPYKDYDIHFSFFDQSEKNAFAERFFEMFGTPLFSLKYSANDLSQDFHYFILLLSEHIKENIEASIWTDLINNEKEELIKELIFSFFLIYDTLPRGIKELFNSISYVPSLRETPKTYYLSENEQFDKELYYGLLYDLDDRTKYNPLGKFKPLREMNAQQPLSEFINKYLKELRIGEEIKLEPISPGNSLYGLYLIENGLEINLSQTSSGFKQLLPIIYKSYYYRGYNRFNQEICIIEQPELHLHPSLQAGLINMFLDKQLMKRKFIIETHSEHIIRKVQVLIAKGLLEKERVAVYYFDKDEKTGATSIKKMEMEDNGFFKEPWPDGFFDDSYNLARELIYARKN